MALSVLNSVFIVMMCLFLNGCNPFWLAKADTKRLYEKEWANPSEAPAREKVYCYATLADKVCYKKPLKGQESRFIGTNYPDVREKHP